MFDFEDNILCWVIMASMAVMVVTSLSTVDHLNKRMVALEKKYEDLFNVDTIQTDEPEHNDAEQPQRHYRSVEEGEERNR